MALYKGKRRLYVCKSPIEVLLLLPKSRYSLVAVSSYTGPLYTPGDYLMNENENEEIGGIKFEAGEK